MLKFGIRILKAIGVLSDEPAACQAKDVVMVRRNPQAEKDDCASASIDPRMCPPLASKRIAVVFGGDPAKQNVEIHLETDTEH